MTEKPERGGSSHSTIASQLPQEVGSIKFFWRLKYSWKHILVSGKATFTVSPYNPNIQISLTKCFWITSYTCKVISHTVRPADSVSIFLFSSKPSVFWYIESTRSLLNLLRLWSFSFQFPGSWRCALSFPCWSLIL